MQNLLEKIKDLDIRIQVEGGNLKLNLPENLDCDSIIEEIRTHKKDLINFIQKKRRGASKGRSEIISTNQTGEVKLTPAQRRLFILDRLVKNSVVYNTPLAIEIIGALDKDLFEKSIVKLIQRHEILRTQFSLDTKNMPIQIVKDEFDFNLERIAATEADVNSIMKDFVRPFDLKKGPLVRAGLIELSEERSVFILDIHHIVIDGVSQKVFVQELFQLYYQQELQPDILQFRDYVHWYYSPDNQNHLSSQRSFWLQELSGYKNDFKLPTDFPREKKLSFAGKSVSFSLGAKRSKQLNKLAKQSDTSLFITLLSVYGVFLSKLTQIEDIVIGTPVANRTQVYFQRMMGMVVNTVPIRLQPKASLRYKDYLKFVTQKALSCFDNQEYIYEELIKDLDLSNDAEANPLFDVLISLNNIDDVKFDNSDLQLIPFEIDKPTAKFDLSMHFTEKAGALECVFEYRTQLYADETIKNYFKFVTNIIDQIINDESVCLKDISLLNEKQSTKLLTLNDFSKTAYPDQDTIVSLFEKQAAANPNNIALIIDEDTFSYGELNAKANQIAKKLRDEGVVRDSTVGLFMGKSFDLIAGMLGVLKAGGAYMPIDLTYPASRIDYIIENSGTKLMVTNKDSVHRLEDFKISTILLEDISTEEQENPSPVNEPNDLAYIIYTSGTTGNPKGVMVEHRNLVRLLFCDGFQFDFSNKDTWAMFHSASFDVSVWEMYGALLYGAKLVVIHPETARNPYKFKNIVKNHKVTVLTQTPTGFYNFIRISKPNENSNFPHLKYVVFCGEELTPAKLLEWHRANPHTHLVNMYGITETTIHDTFKRLVEEDMLTNVSNIGRPVPTNSMYVLDKNLNVVPQGSIGEIYVGGEGVARGYLNKPELTASRFITSPFNENETLYKSGDLARILSNGDLEYLGRNDRQVQIKGFRIELGEIEYQLAQNETVKQAVVVAQKDEKYPWICAYVVTDDEINEEELREFLSCHIPYYMVPNYIVKIDKIPYTSNFKVDYKQLPVPSQIKSSNYVAPSSEQQKIISKVWVKHLASSKVGIKDNFFGLGGDSIRALGVISEMNEALNASFEIADIYEHPTIEELCNYLLVKPTSDREALRAQAAKELEEFQAHYKANFPFDDNYEEVYPMNGVEKGMVFHSMGRSEDSDSFDDIIYHEQNVYSFPGADFKFEVFEECLNTLVRNHSTLRKIFDLENLAHIVLKEIEPDLSFIDLSDLTSKEQEAFIIKKMTEEKLKQTELNFSLFWRMSMIKVSDVHHYLLFDLHHSLFDGWSLSTFMAELRDLYIQNAAGQNIIPEPLETTYRDQVITEIAARLNEKTAEYWKTELQGFERLKLHDTGLPHEYKSHSYDLGKGLRKKLERVAAKNNTNLKHICFAAYLYMMKMYTGMNDLTVGLVSNNRPTTKDGDKLLGCFLNTIPFRAQVDSDITWGEFIKYIETKLIALKRHDKIPLNEIVNLIDEPSSSSNPIFKACFNYIDFHVLGESMELSGDDDKENGFNFKNSVNSDTIFDFNVTAHNSTFILVVNHSSVVMDDVISAKLFQYFKGILNKVLNQLDTKIVQNEILPTSEKEYLLGTALNPADKNKSTTSLAEKFEAQVKKTPTNVAIVCGDRELTYSELYNQTKRLAQYLQKEKNIAPGDFVGIKMARSEWQIIALLGVIQARACYVPIDPAYPEQRVQYLAEDSQCKEVIDMAWMESFLEVAEDYGQEQEDMDYQMSDSVYMIYTSGSTGMPKGVLINNSNISNYVEWAMEYYKGDLDQYNFPYITSLSFDISQPTILLGLLSGGKLYIYGEDLNETMKETMANTDLNSIFITPSHLLMIDDDACAPNIANFILGGEMILPSHIEKLNLCAPNARIFNVYGPTEATVGCTGAEIFRDGRRASIPIGRPVANTKIYILDDQNQLIPNGFVGELCISGEGVAHGYFNRPELSQQRFISDPYSKDGERRMYRTGDLARWASDGQLEIVGRKDDQVKIRGYRIELEEIISCIDKHEMVAQNVVLVKQDNQGNNILVGYIIPKTEAFDKKQFKEELRNELPHYMVPEVLIVLEEFPLTQNGKINKRKLSERSLTTSDAVKVAPRNETEAKLLEIWKEVLDLESIGIHDNFFELGGHSVSSIVLINKIQKEFNVKIAFQRLFDTSSLASLAEFITESDREENFVIAPASVQEFYPLSSVQKRQYFIHQLNPDAITYNVPAFLRITGHLEVAKLERVINKLSERHTIFRTCFKLEDGNPVQWIKENVNQSLASIICSEAEIDEHISAFVQPFDLEKGLPVRYKILEISEEDHILMIDMHHIVFDEASRNIMLKEMMELYQEVDLPEPKLQYKDYAVWQKGAYYQNMVSKHKGFWMDTYAESNPVLELPTDFPRPVELKGDAHVSSITLEKSLSDQIRTIVSKEGTSVFNFMMAAYNVFLSKVSNQNDITVGITTSGRQHADLEGVLGMFSNTLALRNQAKGDLTFQEFLSALHENTVSAFDHQFYPYDDLVNELNTPRITNRNPLFDVFMAYSQGVNDSSFNDSGFVIEPLDMPFDVTKFDLNLDIFDNEVINITIKGRKDLFAQSTIERFMNYLSQIIREVVANPSQKLAAIEVLCVEEKDQLLKAYNDTSVAYDLEKTVLDMFAEQAVKTPKATALQFNEKTVTYGALDSRSTQWALSLIEKGVKKGDIVALHMTRSTEMITAILAVMKAGAAYLPLNTEQPLSRTLHMLEECETKLMINNVAEMAEELLSAYVCLTAELLDEDKGIKGELALPAAQDLAYIIYTSGTTGLPKGVMTHHESISNLTLYLQEYYGINSSERLLQFSPYYFDASVEQIWLALTTGNELILIEEKDLFNPETLNNCLVRNKITHLHATPSFLEKMNLENLSDLRRVIAGGETCSALLAQKIASNYAFYNEYGPTESTVTSTVYAVKNKVELSDNISIGRPIGNTSVYILNQQHQLVPKGAIGELFIGGKGVAKGYLKRPELTAERFIDNPYGTDRLYKTGDLVKWLPDGNLAFVGRADHQVKLNGVRMELGEIESHLKTFEGIKDCVVVVREIRGVKSLVAYYVSENSIAVSEIRMYLLDRLSLNMIPANYVQMEALPLTPSGKLDRKSLPDPDKTERVYKAPSTSTEVTLASIWAEILQIETEEISANDEFFELGGNSLKAIVLINQISKAFSVTPSLRSVFQYQDLQSLGEHIDGLDKVAFVAIPKAAANDYYPLSSAQQRIYFLYELDKEGTTYNMPTMFKLGANLDVNRLAFALKGLVARHQSLRTLYELRDGQPVQRLVGADAFSLNHMKVSESELQSKMKEFVRPFDLSKELPYRAALLETAEGTYTLMTDIHHIAGDGVSTEILMRDFWTLYQGNILEDLKLQYTDYSVWQQGEAYQTLVAEHKGYWMDVYSEEVAVLELPTDHTRPPVLTNEGHRQTKALTEEQSEGLRALAKEEGVTMYTLLLGIYNVFLQKITNEEDIVVGTPTAGRHHADMEGIVGMFVNTLPLRNGVKSDLSFKAFLAQAQDHTISAFDRQLYQYEDLVEALGIQRIVNRNPLFDVFYAYSQQIEGLDNSQSELDIAPHELEYTISKFDLNLDVFENEVINIGMTGRKDLFESSTIERFMEYLNRIIDQVLSDPAQRIEEMSLLSKAEEDQLLGFSQETENSGEVETTPEGEAIVFKGKTLTYRELHANSNQLIPYLQTKGIGEEDMAGLLSRIIMEVLSKPSQETEKPNSSLKKKKKLSNQ